MASTSLPGLPGNPYPDLERHGDALALAIWRQLEGRPAADRHLVWLALIGRLLPNEHFGRSSRGPRAELCRRALLAFAEATMGERSRRRYDTWREGRADKREWPSSTTIRHTFGSWPRSLAACGLEAAPDVRGAALASHSGKLAPAELISALQIWARETGGGERSFAQYHRFAVSGRVTWAGKDYRLPSTRDPFRREFGTWRRALAAARIPWGDDEDRREGWRGPNTAYAPEQILFWLRRAATDLNSSWLAATAFDEWRSDPARRDPAGKTGAFIPCSATVVNRFGSWGAALIAAGLASAADVERRGHGGGGLDDTWLLSVLRRGLKDLNVHPGRTLPEGRYLDWRAIHRADVEAPTGRRLPSISTYARRFGSWAAAVAAAWTFNDDFDALAA